MIKGELLSIEDILSRFPSYDDIFNAVRSAGPSNPAKVRAVDALFRRHLVERVREQN
jgi:hypothetical protein